MVSYISIFLAFLFGQISAHCTLGIFPHAHSLHTPYDVTFCNSASSTHIAHVSTPAQCVSVLPTTAQTLWLSQIEMIRKLNNHIHFIMCTSTTAIIMAAVCAHIFMFAQRQRRHKQTTVPASTNSAWVTFDIGFQLQFCNMNCSIKLLACLQGSVGKNVWVVAQINYSNGKY